MNKVTSWKQSSIIQSRISTRQHFHRHSGFRLQIYAVRWQYTGEIKAANLSFSLQKIFTVLKRKQILLSDVKMN